jgi:hypothetical protein
MTRGAHRHFVAAHVHAAHVHARLLRLRLRRVHVCARACMLLGHFVEGLFEIRELELPLGFECTDAAVGPAARAVVPLGVKHLPADFRPKQEILLDKRRPTASRLLDVCVVRVGLRRDLVALHPQEVKVVELHAWSERRRGRRVATSKRQKQHAADLSASEALFLQHRYDGRTMALTCVARK